MRRVLGGVVGRTSGRQAPLWRVSHPFSFFFPSPSTARQPRRRHPRLPPLHPHQRPRQLCPPRPGRRRPRGSGRGDACVGGARVPCRRRPHPPPADPGVHLHAPAARVLGPGGGTSPRRPGQRGGGGWRAHAARAARRARAHGGARGRAAGAGVSTRQPGAWGWCCGCGTRCHGCGCERCCVSRNLQRALAACCGRAPPPPPPRAPPPGAAAKPLPRALERLRRRSRHSPRRQWERRPEGAARCRQTRRPRPPPPAPRPPCAPPCAAPPAPVPQLAPRPTTL